jgi:hypothetical protein
MDAPASITYARYPARRGALWLKQAYAMFSEQRLPWLFLLVLYYVIAAVVERIPYVGPHVALVLKPVFEVGFLAAAWSQERGEPPRPRHLFQGFRSNLWALIPLGIALLVGIAVAVFATALVDGGTLVEMLVRNSMPTDAELPTGRIQLAMLFGALCAIPVVFALWFAPALVVFQDCRTRRALATSLAAAAANWRPILVYALLVFAFLGVLPGFAATLLAMLVPSEIALILVMPYLLIVAATLHVVDYVCYRDVFHAKEPAATGTASPAAPPA